MDWPKESPPDQYKAKVLNEDEHLMLLKEALWDARSQWKDIGRKLGLKEGDIRAIHDPNDGECLNEVLSQWLHTDKATITDLLKALKSKVIDRPDIAREILSDKHCERFGLDEDKIKSECFLLGLSQVEEIEYALSGKVTLYELRDLPVEKVWYQLGMWLGVDEDTLKDIKKKKNSSEFHFNVDWNVFHQASASNVDQSASEPEFLAYLQKMSMFNEFIMKPSERIHFNEESKFREFQDLLLFINTYKSIKRKEFLDKLTNDECKKVIDALKLKWLKRLCLVESLIQVGYKELAENICNKYDVSLADYLAATDPAGNPPTYVKRCATYLKKRYKKHFENVHASDVEWPPLSETFPEQRFSNLALVKYSAGSGRFMSEEEVESMKHDYVHGKVDNIVAVKQSLELNEIALPQIDWKTNTNRLIILMDGAPGVGKTTLAKKLCIEWANGELLQEYQLVVFVPLREVVGSDNIASFLPCHLEEAKEIASYLEGSMICGKYTMFIFDGFDELSVKDRMNKSLIMKLLSGKILESCSILITSRPYTSGVLKRSINRHIEVLGFTEQQRTDYIEKCISQPEKSKKIIQLLNERLDISGLCYTPLNCNIVLFVFEQNNYELPTTFTELYEIFILHTIKRFQTKLDISSDSIDKVYSLHKLPMDIINKLDHLSKIAFEHLKEDKLIISSDSLHGHEDITSLQSLGLLSSLQSINPRGTTNYYQFLHLTIQEYLAAKWISVSFPKDEQIAFLREHINKSRFRLTLLFLAGITRLHFIPLEESLLAETLNLQNSRFYIINRLKPQQEKFLLLAQLLFESQEVHNYNLIKFKTKVFDISKRSLSNFDSLIVAHFLSTTSKDHIWDRIDLTDCDLHSDSLLYTKCHHLTKQNSLRMTKILHLDEVSFPTLADIVINNRSITEITVHKTINQADHDNMAKFFTVLNSCKVFKAVYVKITSSQELVEISRKSITHLNEITNELCPTSLIQLLRFADPKRLISLDLSGNPNLFKPCACESNDREATTRAVVLLCSTLSRSNIIRSIQFVNCGLTDEIIQKVTPNIVDKLHLREVDFSRNMLRTVGSLLMTLKNHTSLKLCGMHITAKKERVIIAESDDKSALLTSNIFESFSLPQLFSKVNCSYRKINEEMVALILRNNQHLMHLKYQEDYSESSCVTVRNCGNTIKLIKAITAHKLLKKFNWFGIDIEYTTFKINDLQCSGCMLLLIDMQDPQTIKRISLTNCSKAFSDCAQCQVSKESVLNKLCSFIENSKTLQFLDLSCCALEEISFCKITSTIRDCNYKQLQHIELSGNSVGGNNLKCLLHICEKNEQLNIYFEKSHLKVKGCLLWIECKSDNILTILLTPLGIMHLQVKCDYNYPVSISSLLQFLSNNPHMTDIELSVLLIHNLDCEELCQLTQKFVTQQSLQRISFKVKECFSQTKLSRCSAITHVISRTSLCWPESSICPKEFDHLVHFLSLKSDSVKTIILGEIFSTYCEFCLTPWETLHESFCAKLTKFHNIECIDIRPSQSVIEPLLTALKDKPNLCKIVLRGYSHVSQHIFEKMLMKMIVSNLRALHLFNIYLEIKGKELHIYCSDEDDYYFCHILKFLSNCCGKVNSLYIVYSRWPTGSCGLSEKHNKAIHLLLSSNQEISVLGFSQSYLSSGFVSCLFTSVADSKSLLQLHLSSTQLTGHIVANVLEIISFTEGSLEHLNISENNLLADCNIETLGRTFQVFLENNKSMKALNLSNCNLNGIVALSIANGLISNTVLRELDISKHSFNEEDNFIEVFTLILTQNTSLKILNLSSSTISNAVFNVVGKSLSSNNSLQELYLDDISFTQSLSSVLTQNPWVDLFVSLQHNKSLHTLSLCSNHFDKIDIESMKKLLRTNKQLTSLRMIKCSLSPWQRKELQALLPSVDFSM